MKTCALCGWRDAVETTDWDGRDVPACGVCLDPPDEPPHPYEPADLLERYEVPEPRGMADRSTRNAIIVAIRRHGAPAMRIDICHGVGVDPNGSEAKTITQALCRMAKRGEVKRTPRPGGGLYTVPEEVPDVAELVGDRVARAVLERLDAGREVVVREVVEATGADRNTVTNTLRTLGEPLVLIKRGRARAWVRDARAA